MKLLEKMKSLSQNDKIIYKNLIGAFIVKGAALLVSLFTMPAYLRYFSNEPALGVWFTILSILTWILNFDFGIGNGLRNRLTESFVEENYIEAKKYISSAYVSISFIVLILLAIFFMVFNFA